MVRDKVDAVLALGSNLGERFKNLDAAQSVIASAGGIYLDQFSPTYDSPAAEEPDQPDFLNRVLAIQTWLAPRELLAICLQIEKELGRVRERVKGPRVIDADILLYGDLVIDEPDLKIPHAALTTRPFFLKPLQDVAGDIVLPGHNVRLSQILAELAPYELAVVTPPL